MSAIPDKEARCLAVSALIAKGQGVVESCREVGGLSEKTFQRWRKARDAAPSPGTGRAAS